MMMLRRFGCCVLTLLSLSLTAHGVAAQAYPSKVIRILVGAPAGGSTDILARLVGQKLGERLQQSVIVENRAGANMIIASEAAAKAEPDGHTLIMVPSNHVINGGIYAKLPYDPIKDFSPIAMLARLPLMLVVHPSMKVNSVQDLVQAAKTEGLFYSSSGIGSPHHLGMELLASRTGVKMTHVPFKGAADSITEIHAGRVPVGIITVPPGLELVKAGQLRAIASVGTERVKVLPEMPTVAESGLPDFSIEVWLGILAPAGTPQPIIEKLNSEFVSIANLPDIKERLIAQGFEPHTTSASEFLRIMQADLEKYREVAKLAGVKLN
jgi:tripartite-type tricarboxylate transporter receptor subunit TctC